MTKIRKNKYQYRTIAAEDLNVIEHGMKIVGKTPLMTKDKEAFQYGYFFNETRWFKHKHKSPCRYKIELVKEQDEGNIYALRTKKFSKIANCYFVGATRYFQLIVNY